MIVLRSASLTCGFGGIGTWPQTPDPPFLTLSKSFAGALASPLYLAATSTYAGPTSFLSIEWQAVQPFFLIRSSPASAWTAPAATRPAAANAQAAIFFIASPELACKGLWMLPERVRPCHQRAPRAAR